MARLVLAQRFASFTLIGVLLGIVGLFAELRGDSCGDGTQALAAMLIVERAAELTNYARQNESVVSMLAAIEMLGRVSFAEGGHGQKVSRRHGALELEQSEGIAGPITDMRLLAAEAKEWASDDIALTRLIDETLQRALDSQPGGLGGVNGPVCTKDEVLGSHTDIWCIEFVGGELARISVVGNGQTDLDLLVKDESGNSIDAHFDQEGRCYAEWTPKHNQTFKIWIVNNGVKSNKYLLLTN